MSSNSSSSSKPHFKLVHGLVEKLRAITLKEPPTAKKLKNYKILELLGQGTFGTVCLCVHIPTGEQVAMKTILKYDAKTGSISDPSDKIAQAVHREMNVLSQLCHPNVVSLLDWFETKDKFHLVFEYASGGELYDRLANKGKFSEENAVDLVRTLFEAVAYLHHNGIVHRDLKPENILFRDSSPDAEVVIADFGTANFVHDGDLLSTMCGSPMYASPEIFLRTGHSFPTDIWSMGIITFCILAGYPPFDFANDIPELVDAICHAKYKFESPWWDNVSKEAKDFITSILKIDAKERPTVDECLQHPWLNKKLLDSGLSHEGLKTNNLADHWPKEEPLRKRRSLRSAVGVVLALNRLKNANINKLRSAALSARAHVKLPNHRDNKDVVVNEINEEKSEISSSTEDLKDIFQDLVIAEDNIKSHSNAIKKN